jgi:hypothetical protein
MNAHESQPESAAEKKKSRVHTTSEIVVTVVAAATLLLSIATAIKSANDASEARKSAEIAQQLFQGSDACRAIRTEIVELHQAGLTEDQITTVLKTENVSDSFRHNKLYPHGGNAIDEDNYECGRKPKSGVLGQAVQQWIHIISQAPVTTKPGG